MIRMRCEPEEPMHCMKKGCQDELNGLWHLTENKGGGILMETWLCAKHAKQFAKRMKL